MKKSTGHYIKHTWVIYLFCFVKTLNVFLLTKVQLSLKNPPYSTFLQTISYTLDFVGRYSLCLAPRRPSLQFISPSWAAWLDRFFLLPSILRANSRLFFIAINKILSWLSWLVTSIIITRTGLNLWDRVYKDLQKYLRWEALGQYNRHYHHFYPVLPTETKAFYPICHNRSAFWITIWISSITLRYLRISYKCVI